MIAVRQELLEALAAEAPLSEAPKPKPASTRPTAKPSTNGKGSGHATQDDMTHWLAEQGLDLHKPPTTDSLGRTIYALKNCPFDITHVKGSSCVMTMDSGAKAFRCLHNSCQDRKWADLRAHLGGTPPPQNTHNTQNAPASPAPESAPWDPPTPLDQAGGLPAFPISALSPWLRDYVGAVAVATQTPVDLGAMLALGAVATAVAKKVVVQIRGSWREPLNIYVVVVLAPGNRKSSVFAEMTKSIFEFERSQNIANAPKIERIRSSREIADTRAKDARTKAAKTDDKALEAEAVKLSVEASQIEVPAAVRVVADDTTPEALAGLLAQQGGRMAVLSAEATIFSIIVGRYSATGTPNMEVVLKSHAGDALRIDRKSRDPEIVDDPALTMALTIQPDVLAGLLRVPGFKGRGLLGRLLYSIPESPLGHRVIAPPQVPDGVQNDYDTKLTRLLTWCQPEPGRKFKTLRVSLSPEAVAVVDEFATWLEPQLAKGAELGDMADWAGKCTGAVVRIAGLLHAADYAESTPMIGNPIQSHAMRRAVQIGRYLIAHAMAAYDVMGEDEARDDARAILNWLTRNKRERVCRRDVHQAMRGRFKKADQIDPALTILAEHGYLRALDAPERTGPGRPPSPAYLVNPRLEEPTVGSPTPTPKTEPDLLQHEDASQSSLFGPDPFGTDPPTVP